MATVEQNGKEPLLGGMAQPRVKVGMDVGRATDRRAGREALGGQATAQLERGAKAGALCGSDAGYRYQVVGRGPGSTSLAPTMGAA